MANNIGKGVSSAVKGMQTRQQQEQERLANADKTMNGYIANPSGGFQLSGTSEEIARQASNLSQVGAMTGKDLFDIGEDSMQYDSNLQARLNGGDPVAQHMMNQRNRSMANMGRQFAGKGVAGGVAGAAMSTAGNTADSDINAQMYKNQRTNNQDLLNWVKRNQKVSGEALAMGSDQGLASQMSTDVGGGLTVICTELHAQGLMPDSVLKADREFGENLIRTDFYAYFGYVVWAVHFVTIMRKSKLFTKAVSMLALPWARHISGDKNIIGGTVLFVGLPLCRTIGFLVATYFSLKKA